MRSVALLANSIPQLKKPPDVAPAPLFVAHHNGPQPPARSAFQVSVAHDDGMQMAVNPSSSPVGQLGQPGTGLVETSGQYLLFVPEEPQKPAVLGMKVVPVGPGDGMLAYTFAAAF